MASIKHIKPEDWEYYAYIKEKTKIEETCDCRYPKQLCGICFWKGVTIPPEMGHKYRCKRCIEDTEAFKQCTQKKFAPTCCKSCIWWDFYDNRRREYAKNNKKKLEYNFTRNKIE